MRYLAMLTVCVVSALHVPPAGAQQDGAFRLQEATVAGIHVALAARQLTCTQVTSFLYLDRIAAYDAQGPALHAIITVNPKAMEVAAEMDRGYQASPASVGALHCIPVILKDTFNTVDMPTTAGNISMKTSVPPADAFTVARIRKAGALILAKANMQEFARGGMSISSLGGQVRNPYDLGRTPGGSSGGTGAAIASNFAVLGTGSDTGQSIRSPASANNLVGIRPTRGLVSRSGVIPNSLTQDEVGPIARTVTDAALLLDVMAGYDPADPITAFGKGHIPGSYAQLLDPGALKGARIGVMTNLFGTAERHGEVNQVMEGVIARMAGLGATIVRFDLPAYDVLAPVVSTSQFEARNLVMDRYLAPSVPMHRGQELCGAGRREDLGGAEDARSRACRRRWDEQRSVQGADAEPGQATARRRRQDGRPRSRRHPVSAAEDTGGAGDGRGAVGAQWHAVQRHRIPGGHVPGRVLRPDLIRAARRAGGCRTPGARLQRG